MFRNPYPVVPCTFQSSRSRSPAREDLFRNDIHARAGTAETFARSRLQRLEIADRIEQAVGMIDADTGDESLPEHFEQQSVCVGKHRGSSMRRPARSLTSKKRR